MSYKYNNLEKKAKRKEKENWKFRSFLKFYDGMSDEEIDKLVYEVTDEVWSSIDCTECGRCCIGLKPTLSEDDQTRLADKLKISIGQLQEQYLQYNDEDEFEDPCWDIKESPCPFLQDDKCTVYNSRPEDCRGYPYLYEPDFISRAMGMIGRTFACPIVYKVVEVLKKRINWK